MRAPATRSGREFLEEFAPGPPGRRRPGYTEAAWWIDRIEVDAAEQVSRAWLVVLAIALVAVATLLLLVSPR